MKLENLKTFLVDAATLRTGDLIDRGSHGMALIRMIVRVRHVTLSLPVEGLEAVPAVEVMHRRIDGVKQQELGVASFARGAKVRVLLS